MFKGIAVPAEKQDKCWLCGSTQIRDLYQVNGFTLTRCGECSLRFIRELADDAYLKELYTFMPGQENGEKREYLKIYLDPANETNLKYSFRILAGKVRRRFKPFGGEVPLKLLDLGCSIGALLDFFPDWDVYGIEIEETMGNIAKQKHKNIVIGNMKDADFDDNFFDCITILDALDHTNDPVHVVKNSCRQLKQNGMIAIKVHNINCLLAKLTGKRFYAIQPPAHLTYFSLKTLKQLLAACGFEYAGHFYDTQKMPLETAVMRASETFPFLTPVYKALSKTPLGSLPVYKNFHDIITIFGIKQ